MFRAIIAAVAIVCVAGLCQAQTPGSVANFEADNNPAANDAQDWDSTVGSLSWVLDGGGAGATPSLISGISDGKTLITSAYQYDGNDEAVMAADWPNTTQDGTFEFWIRPADLSGDEIIFDVGGATDGSSLRLDDNILTFQAKDSAAVAEASANLNGVFVPGEFIQVVAEVDLTGDEVRLYIDGQFVDDDQAAGLNDFAGTDNNGLGSFSGAIGGNLTEANYNFFEGDIAILRFSNSLLGPDAILANFEALELQVPEPASIALWSLLGLAAVVFVAFRASKVGPPKQV